MQRRFLLVCVALLALPSAPAHAIRYELIDGAAGDQDGHTLTGFIEFDRPSGFDSTAANIIDFSFSVTGPSEYSYSYEGPEDVELTQRFDTQFLHAGPQYLTLDFSKVGRFVLRDAEDNRPVLRWQANFVIIHPDFTTYASYEDPNQFAWTSIPSKVPIIIGVVVPEPAALMLGLTAVVLGYLRACVQTVSRSQDLACSRSSSKIGTG
jgi:hypothetical protein